MRRASGICLTAVVVLACGTLIAPVHGEETLEVTAKCGTISFVGSKDDGIHQGGFKKFSGKVHLVPDNAPASRVMLEIDTGSLWSDHPNLSAHLLNADFFHVEKFPKAVFRSTAIREAIPKDRKAHGRKDVTHVLTGKLTLLGVSKEINLPAKIKLTGSSLDIDGVYAFDRTLFGMNYGIGKVHKEVGVSFSLKVPRGEPKSDPPVAP